MPLPTPTKGETEEAYVQRFMHEMSDEFDTQEQRLAVAYSTYRRAHKSLDRTDPRRSARIAKALGVENYIPGMHLVGPASPAEEFDKLDSKGQEEYTAWRTARERLVHLGKRIGLVRDINRPDELVNYSRRHRPPISKARRARLRKDSFSLGAFPAPSTTGTDQDIDARTHDFVDDILEPPYPFDIIASLNENSSALRQNVDAMAVNVDGFGYRLEPVLPWDHPDVNNHIRDLMLFEAIEKDVDIDGDLSKLDTNKLQELTPDIAAVESQRMLWERLAMIEKMKLAAFFEFINPIESFNEVRSAMRESLELLGNAGWEIIREDPENTTSKIVQVYNVPFASVRLIRADRKPTTITMRIRRDAVTYEEIQVQRFFRRFVRITGIVRVYYKEMGDPRTVSRMTGRYYQSIEHLKAEEGENAQPANEIMHWKIRSQMSPYGTPRWIGALLSVMGSRAAEEVNFLYFDNKAIPPMILMVSGGRLTTESVSKIESHFQERLKGRENFHKIMVIEALPSGTSEGETDPTGKMTMHLEPLMGQMQKDQMFGEYDAANMLKIGRAFRQPGIYTGATADMNRSTSDTAKAITEEQVYQPARDAFDAAVDRLFLPNHNIRFWRFKTNAPVQRIPNDLVANAMAALSGGAIVPNEARALLSDAFSKDLVHRSEDWANMPPALAAAGAKGGAPPGGPPVPDHVAAGIAQAMGEGAEGTPKPPKPEGGGNPFAGGGGADKGGMEPEGAAKSAEALRGQTSMDAGHKHPFIVTRDGEWMVILTLPSGDSPHQHPAAKVPYEPGKWFSVQLEAATPDQHTHTVGFKVPFTPEQENAQKQLKGIATLRMIIEDAVEKGKKDFFDPQYYLNMRDRRNGG